MAWITIIWSMIASAVLVIASVYLFVWWRQRESRDFLMFVLLAISTAGIAGTELWMMHSVSIDEFGTALRWFHVPISTVIFACIAMVYYRLGSNKLWLGWVAVVLRVLALFVNFIQHPNINYSEITSLERITVLGEQVSIVQGVPSPSMLIANLGLLFLIIFVVDSAVAAVRRHANRSTIALGVAFSVLVIGGSVQAMLIFWEIVQLPVIMTPLFLGLTIVMGIELSLGVLRSMTLERRSARQKTQLAQLSKAATLSEVSAALAHQINQPLSAILSNAEAADVLLGKDAPDIKEIRQIVGDIIAADRRAADIISRLRSLLHQKEPNFEYVSINDVIEDALRHSREDNRNQIVGIKAILAGGIPDVHADRTLLVQAILNLLMNACDAVAGNLPGNRSITIRSAIDGQTIHTTVIDNGSGLPQDPAQLFDPFFTTKTSGLGMGLAVAQSVATAHDGRIWADVDSAGNTNFHFCLPVGKMAQ